MVTIGHSEAELELTLGRILVDYLPQTAGYSPEIEIYENGRKKRRDASRDSWRPGSGEIRIRFGGATTKPQSEISPGLDVQDPVPSHAEALVPGGARTPLGQLADLVKSLEKAEQRPGFEFVSLKWFRDLFLPAEAHEWAASSTARHEALRQAINDGIVLTSKVPNPKAPAFPVTAIRLNRQHPEFVAILGEPTIAASSFQPVNIRGEALSQTVLRERR